MYRFIIRCLLTVAVCLLAIIFLYSVVFGITFPAVCITITLTFLISFIYQNSNGKRNHSPNLGSPPVDSDSSGTNMVDSGRSSQSPGAPVTSPQRRPGAISNDRAQVSDRSSMPSSAGPRSFDRNPNSVSLGQPRLRGNGTGTNVGTGQLPNKTKSTSSRSQASDYIPVQTTKGEHSNRSLAEGKTTSISPNPRFPKSGCPVGSDDTAPELFPYAGQISRNTANEIVTHPTHQSQYGSLGVLPLVHLSEAPHTSNVHGNRSLSHSPVTVKIAPPDPLIDPVQFIQSGSMPPSSQTSTSSTGVSNTLTEQRKRNAQHGGVLETGKALQQQSNKRRKLDDNIEPSSSSNAPIIGTSGSDGMNLKRPALRDTRAEMGATKHRCVQPSAGVPSSTSQRGASARNPTDASYSSSQRWLKRKAGPDIYQDISQSSLAETELQSPIGHHSGTSEGQATRSIGEEEHFRSSPTVSQPSGCNNSSSYASLDKSASYKVHLTSEDVEGDRDKEMERGKYMLGEASDLVQDAELGRPALRAVSSSSAPASFHLATSGSQPASELPSVATSVSPAAERMSTGTAAPNVQQHTSAGTTVAYSTYSTALQTESAQRAVRYDLTSSAGSSLGHLPVLSAANPNPPASLNPESTVFQSSNPTSAASSVILTAPPITTLASPVCSTGFTLAAGSLGGFKFDPHASNKTSLSGFAANPSSLTNTVGGFKFVPSNKSTSAACSLQFPQCVTASEIVTGSFHLPDVTQSSTVSASTNSAAVFSFGQTTGQPALSFSQPHTTSTAVTLLTNADSSVINGTKTSFSGMFGCSVSSSGALNSAPSSSTNAVPFGNPLDGNLVTGMIFNSRGFSPGVDMKNQSLAINPFDRQHTLVSNSVQDSQLKSANNAGNQPMPVQNFGTCTTSALTFGALPAFGAFGANQPLQPISFGSQQAVTNSFSIQPTTAIAFNNQYTSVNTVMSSPVTSVNPLGNSNASLFSFTNPTSVNFPSNSEATVLSFNNPTSTVSISKASLPAFSFNNPTSTNLFGSQPQASGQFANQGNNSASGFGGLPPNSDVFGSQQLTSSNSGGIQQMASFNFGTPTTLGNVFASQNKPDTNIFGNHVGVHVTQTGGFGSYAGLSAPNPLFTQAQPQFTQAQFSFPPVCSGDLNNSSVLSPAFQFPHNVATTSVVTSTQPPAAPNPFSSDTGFSQLQNNMPTMNFGQFPTQPNQFSTAQPPPFASQTLLMPRFSIGTDNSNSAKNRTLSKTRLRRKP